MSQTNGMTSCPPGHLAPMARASATCPPNWPPHAMAPWWCRLPTRAVIRASGEDAAELPAQPADQRRQESGCRRPALRRACAPPRAGCWPPSISGTTGRTSCSLLSADIQPAILKKLSMYMLRSKVKLTDANRIGPARPGGTDGGRADWDRPESRRRRRCNRLR